MTDRHTRRSARATMRDIDFGRINAAALPVLPAICARLFPAGRVVGAHFLIGNLRGAPGASLKVDLRRGRWRDFATGVGGGDTVSLVAAVANVSQGEAARLVARMLSLGDRHG